jgi:hypothetical protein
MFLVNCVEDGVSKPKEELKILPGGLVGKNTPVGVLEKEEGMGSNTGQSKVEVLPVLTELKTQVHQVQTPSILMPE